MAVEHLEVLKKELKILQKQVKAKKEAPGSAGPEEVNFITG